MKKRWYYLAATLLMVGCAEDAFEDGSNVLETEARQEIKLSAGTTGIEVGSRGAGTVGDLATETTTNVWNGEQLTIWAIKNKANDLTLDDESNVYLSGVNATATASSGTNTTTLVLDNAPVYYPLQGAFNFTGYYIDDATTTTDVLVRETNAITQPVTIDGSQDIMIAKAELTAQNKIDLVKALIENDKLTGAETDYVDINGDFQSTFTDTEKKSLIETEYKKAFSSYTARRKVQPQMTFEHQLARLQFAVIAGDENAKGASNNVTVEGTEYAKGIHISNITIKNAKKQGVITIDNIGNITFAPTASAGTGTDTTIGDLTLKNNTKNSENKLETLVEQAPENLYEIGTSTKDDYTRIGESILAFPADKYIVDIETKQYVQLVKGTTDQYELVDGTTGKTTSYTNVTLQLGKDQNNNQLTFEKGKTYDILVKVYSNQEIVITATLAGWVQGDDVTVSPEDDLFDQEFNSGTGTTNP